MRVRLAALWETLAVVFNGPRCTHGNFTGEYGYYRDTGDPSVFSDCAQCRMLGREQEWREKEQEARNLRAAKVAIVRDGILAAWKLLEEKES